MRCQSINLDRLTSCRRSVKVSTVAVEDLEKALTMLADRKLLDRVESLEVGGVSLRLVTSPPPPQVLDGPPNSLSAKEVEMRANEIADELMYGASQ